MTSIPLPSSIANAGIYPSQVNAIPIDICKIPAEGARVVPFQVAFNMFAAILIDMTKTTPSGSAISQTACIFVDASMCANDVNILFPDTGYQVRIGQGAGQLVPIFTGRGTPPKFYVISDSNGATSSDIVNVFVCNQFIPEFLTANTNKVISTLMQGYGTLFSEQVPFTRNQAFLTSFGSLNLNATKQIIKATQFYLSAIDINISAIFTGVSIDLTMKLIDSSDATAPAIWQRQFVKATSGVTSEYNENLLNISDLNFQSAGNSGNNNGLRFVTSTTGGTVDASFELYINAYGGVLIP